jgi:carboxylesterase
VPRDDVSSADETSQTDRSISSDTLPFFLRGTDSSEARTGCLLIHGFTGTPQEMRFLGERMHRCGYTVNGVRLAGHGTSIDDFAPTTWHDWYRSACVGLEELQRDTRQVVAVGQSMGALLALKLAAEHPRTVVGLALLSPALVLSNPWVRRIAPALRLLLPLARQRRWRIRGRQRDIADRQAREESPSYRDVPLQALYQLVGLQRHVLPQLPQVRQPALIIHSRQDHTCSPNNVAILKRGLGGPVRAVWLEESFHVISIDVDKERVATEVTAFVENLAGAVAPPTR